MNMECSPWWNRLAAFAACLALITPLTLLASCNDDSADMASQISGGGKPAGGGGGAAKPAGGDSGGAKGAAGQKPGLPGKAGGQKLPGLPGKPGDEPAAEGAEGEKGTEVDGDKVMVDGQEVPQPKLSIKILDIHGPPMYEDAGRYDLKVEVTLEEYVDAKVWKIVALDGEGKEVGTDLQFLYFPLNQPQTFAFNDLYCMKKPTDVKLIYTGKDAKKPGGDGGEKAEKGGVKGGGVSGGTGTAPKAPGGSGGKSEGGGEDKGGGDAGAEEGED